MIMKCGHEVKDYDLIKDDGIVYIQYTCEEGCTSEWACVAEAPYGDDVEMENIVCDEV